MCFFVVDWIVLRGYGRMSTNFLPELGVHHPLTFHILIFSSRENTEFLTLVEEIPNLQ
jgi:hypothetical protein